MSYFNQYKDVEIKLPSISGRVDGEYMIEAFQGVEFPKDSGNVFEFAGTRRTALPWFDNIVTDGGLELYGIGGLGMAYCHVGRDNTPETATDTGLGDFVAGTAKVSQTPAAESTAPYFGHATYKYRFSPNFGGGNVNINEVGVGTTVTTGNLSSRSLTKNQAGDPATVPVLSTEYLDVYYKRRNYPAHIVEATGAPTDDTGSIDVSGTPYGYTIRPCFVTYGGGFSPSTSHGWATGMEDEQLSAIGYAWNISSRGKPIDENAALGSVTGVMSGGTDSFDATGAGTYVNFSYARELWWQAGVDDANFSVGIGGLVIKTALGMYQILFDTPIPKVVGENFIYYHNFSWNRKTSWV